MESKHDCLSICEVINDILVQELGSSIFEIPSIESYLLLISMIWHKQAIFESNRDMLNTGSQDTISPADWKPAGKPTELSRIKLQKLVARPLDQRAFSPLDPTAGWLSHLALAICMFVYVNFDAMAQASDFTIKRRPFFFLYWMQDSNPGFQTPNRQMTEWPLTIRLRYRRSFLRAWQQHTWNT